MIYEEGVQTAGIGAGVVQRSTSVVEGATSVLSCTRSRGSILSRCVLGGRSGNVSKKKKKKTGLERCSSLGRVDGFEVGSEAEGGERDSRVSWKRKKCRLEK